MSRFAGPAPARPGQPLSGLAPRVVPRSRLDLLDPFEVAKLGGIEVITEGVVEGFLSGLHRSPRRGFSVEFAEHRMYQPGDELRYVDWKILGRNDRLYVKQYEEETNLRAVVVCDISRSMAWTSAPDAVLPKLVYAQRLIAALGLVLLRQRDAIGLIAFDDEIRTVLPPRARLSHWRQLVQTLATLARQESFSQDQVIFHEGDDYSIFYLLGEGMISLELEAADRVLRVQTLYAGDVFDWSALLPHAGKHFQARALTPVTALAFEGEQLLAAFKQDPQFGLAFMLRLMGVVSDRLRAARVQLLDMYLPEAKRAGT